MATYRVDHPELHTPDLKILATVTTPQHARENELARAYRENKYGLRMSSVPWELFYSFMQDNKLLLIQGIVNQYLDVEGELCSRAGADVRDDRMWQSNTLLSV